jgi:LmbE family N-acetylglucosaminyl deacetylase
MNDQLPPGEWSTPQRILVILAHPDDPEFFCGATLAHWSAAGHEVSYCLLTCGDKGSDRRDLSGEALCADRQEEQRRAAAVLGVKQVRFMNYPDGYLTPTLEMRREITRVIRQERPDILVTCDPTNLFPAPNRINHPDHRAAGQVVLDALFPAAGNHRYFYELLDEEGLEPHMPREVWVSLTAQPDVVLDATARWEQKIRALQEHKSQIGDPEQLAERMRQRHTPESTREAPRYEEKFRRLVFA